jgi:hypothetical protein
MAWVTKDQIQRAREVDVLDYVLTNERDNVRRVGSGYRLKDHPSISIKKGGWYRHSLEYGGRTALDDLTNVRGYGLIDAVCMLINERPQKHPGKSESMPPAKKITPKALSPPVQPERKPFSLPTRNTSNTRVIAYLQSRGIERPLIMACIQNGSLYESAKYHNCVFLGRDDTGKARFAALRGTMSGFKCDAEGSEKRFGFVLPPSNPDSDTVAIFEAPIDCLSHKTMACQGFIEPFDGWRLSLGGTALAALSNFLERHTSVRHCLICTDNDEAGDLAAARIAELPGITSERCVPVGGNDWNDGLLALQKADRLQACLGRGTERS